MSAYSGKVEEKTYIFSSDQNIKLSTTDLYNCIDNLDHKLKELEDEIENIKKEFELKMEASREERISKFFNIVKNETREYIRQYAAVYLNNISNDYPNLNSYLSEEEMKIVTIMESIVEVEINISPLKEECKELKDTTYVVFLSYKKLNSIEYFYLNYDLVVDSFSDNYITGPGHFLEDIKSQLERVIDTNIDTVSVMIIIQIIYKFLHISDVFAWKPDVEQYYYLEPNFDGSGKTYIGI